MQTRKLWKTREERETGEKGKEIMVDKQNSAI